MILFSHPADFTPICTSRCSRSDARTAEFRALNCELIGLSVDSPQQPYRMAAYDPVRRSNTGA
ncbi:MAG: redoxin domain-containing protein [Alistipes onderdonkii]